MKQALLVILICLGGTLSAQTSDEIIGIWWNEEKDGRVEVFKKNGKFFGRIEYIENDENDDGTSPRVDSKNPEENLRNRTLKGLVILKDLEWDGEEWEGGEIYDSKSGNTYSCFAKMNDNGTLYFKGYVGFSLIGRSTTWTRYKE